MKTILSVNGQKIRRAVILSGFSKEQVVASVQDSGLRFSLTGLDKLYRGELPVRDSDEILEAIALKCSCLAMSFANSEAQTA
jgi:hypothetical protein